MILENIDIFHVHTYRCGHAENCMDEDYIRKAISLGAKSIAFTDHAPFPKDPFGNRMRIEELKEYLSTLKSLKEKYSNNIEIYTGLEVEYFDQFLSYYEDLRENPNIDLLVLGQHMYMTQDGNYSFNLPKEYLENEEFLGLGNSIISGIKTGLFDAVAHPDRIFRRRKSFGSSEQKISEIIINTAISHDIPLEVNKSSIREGLYVPEFWRIAQNFGADIIYGYDAHSPDELCPA